MKVTLHSGIEIVGNFQHKLSDATSITLLTYYPYIVKQYLDSTSSFNGLKNCTGIDMCDYRSDAFKLTQGSITTSPSSVNIEINVFKSSTGF